jgi:hypothetical protein
LSRWEDNIKMGIKGLGWDGMDWISLARDVNKRGAVVNSVMNLLIPYDTGDFLTS